MDNDFLATLKSRLQDAQKWMQEAQQKLAVAQNEFQRASQEFNSWNYAVAVETQRVNGSRPAGPAVHTVLLTTPIVQAPSPALGDKTEIVANKTELIRTFLKQHPNGSTPTDIWQAMKADMGRAYIYSVLKRLKDKDQIQERRGKYYFKHQPEPQEEPLS